MRYFAAFYFLLSFSGLALAKPNAQDNIKKGPLHLSADETIAREQGRYIEAYGNVRASYDLENGDKIESFSQRANYYEKEELGDLTGNPKAIWKRKNESDVELKADKIILKVKQSELEAYGNVLLVQSSNALTSQQIIFLHTQKKMVATGGRPEFSVVDATNKTKISADQIEAWTEKKQIHFKGNVRGTVLLEK